MITLNLNNKNVKVINTFNLKAKLVTFCKIKKVYT